MTVNSLTDAMARLATTPRLLVACDFDGTLSEIVVDPDAAAPNPAALHAMRELGRMPGTTAAVISGRSVSDLAMRLGERTGGKAVAEGRQVTEWWIGSHGAEWRESGVELSASAKRSLEEAAREVGIVVEAHPGVRREIKPGGVALHLRGVERDVAAQAIGQAIARCAPLPDVRVRYGSEVVEFLVTTTHKGEAIQRARHESGASAVFFVGDDLTDEDAFRALGTADVGVRVGAGESRASYRVHGVAEVSDLLERLAERRRAWLAGRAWVPLDRCAVLSDQRTLAVVAPGARLAWLCLPRVDSPALFGHLLGEESAGGFDIAPSEPRELLRSAYDGDSFILVSDWGDLRVTDYLDCSGGRAFQRAGRVDLLRVIEGTIPARVRFAPRLDFGRIATSLRLRDEGLEVEGSNDPIVLRAPGVTWTIRPDGMHQTAEATVDPSAGPVVIELRYGTASMRPPVDEEPERREQNRRFWSGWTRSLSLPPARRDVIRRSALVIKALCHGPTGAIAAAATTSLPEVLGGERNWDYRYCWPRDGAMAAAALVRLGNTGHALKFLDWMLEVVDRCESPERLHPIYTVSGGSVPAEADLGHLTGYADSRPVRIGNAAANQVQLDVFGPIVDLVALLAERGAPIAPDHWRLVRAMTLAVERRWSEPDHGIWEMRIERRHHVHSKVMCWHTVSRALVVEEAFAGTRNAGWEALAENIRSDVLANAWSDRLGSYAGAYGHDIVDAATLSIGLTGLVAPSDPRWIDTVRTTQRVLASERTVRRYRMDDGLPGDEGGMHICTGWLIESLRLIGALDEARSLFERLADLVRGCGILSEQYDDERDLAIGNLAQAYSHVALINAAVALGADALPEPDPHSNADPSPQLSRSTP